MRHARKYVVGWMGGDYVYNGTGESMERATWKDAKYVAENVAFGVSGDVIEVYALVPVAAWKCVKGKDGTRKMVKVKVSTRVIEAAERAKSVTGDGKGGA